MSRFGRATGVAVAAIAIALGAVFAGPSQAEETAGVPTDAPYTEHAVNAPELGVLAQDLRAQDLVADIATNLPEAGAVDSDVAAPVIDHSAAVFEAPAIEETLAPPRTKSLSELVNYYASDAVPDAEMECLAGAVYFESKGEPLSGQLAVAEVIINRAKSGRFPSTMCGVVKQRGQFSFVRGGRFPPIARDSVHWRKAVAIAQIARQELAAGAAPRALFFHARRVSPGWRLTRVAAVGNHIFYR